MNSCKNNKVDKYIKTNHLIITGNLNARVGNVHIPDSVETFRRPITNNNGQILRQSVTLNELKIANIFFRKKDGHKCIWSASGLRSVIDYIIQKFTAECICN